MSAAFVVIVLSILAMTTADIPSGYIMQITPTCGEDGVEDGHVDIITDLNAAARAVCKDGTEVDFLTTDGVNFRLPFSYQGGSEIQDCIFNKRDKSDVYAAKVIVSYGEPDSLIHQYSEEYQITCTFSPRGFDDSAHHTIDESLIAATEMQSNMGNSSGSRIVLKMVDILLHDLTGKQVDLGRTIRLWASFKGNETGIRPVSCDAIDSNRERYAILRAGCGDGIVLGKNQGFETTLNETLSPYFQAFNVNADPALQFECNFTLCDSACDGDSCALETSSRRRRGVFSLARKVSYHSVTSKMVSIKDKSRPPVGGIGAVHRL